MYIPRFIYEHLPKAYVFIAFFGISMKETLGKVCGVMLFVAAAQIIKMRHDNRKYYESEPK